MQHFFSSLSFIKIFIALFLGNVIICIFKEIRKNDFHSCLIALDENLKDTEAQLFPSVWDNYRCFIMFEWFTNMFIKLMIDVA